MKKLNALEALKLMRDGKYVKFEPSEGTVLSVLDNGVIMERGEEQQIGSFADFLYYFKNDNFKEIDY